MHRLVALDLPAGPAFVFALEAILERGDAVLPIDQRLPDPARKRLYGALRPGAVIDPSGEHELSDGQGVEPGDALVIATSGTTGEPKGVVLTRESLDMAAAMTSKRLAVRAAADRWCSCLPLSHVGGLGVVLRALFTGTPVEIHETFDADTVAAAATERGATLTSLVPTTLARLGERALAFRAILVGGARSPSERPPNAICTYGMSESAGGVVYDGRPLDGVELRIERDGEIALRSPTLLRAYRDGTDPKSPDGWYRTGDAGALTDGRLVVNGRLDDVIISGGEKIWPAAVESVLAVHGSVAQVAIGGVDDPEWGSRVVAYVVAALGGEPPALGALRDLVEAEIGSWAAPRELRFVEALPTGSGGKVLRHELAGTPFRAASSSL